MLVATLAERHPARDDSVTGAIPRLIAIAIALLLAGCEGDARPLITSPTIVVMTFMPDRASLDAERRRTSKFDPGPVNGFARWSGAACHIFVLAPGIQTRTEWAETAEHELRHCVEGHWHD